VAFASFIFELVKPDTTLDVNLMKDSKKMSMRRNIHLYRTVNLFLGIIPGFRERWTEFNYSELSGSPCLITGALG